MRNAVVIFFVATLLLPSFVMIGELRISPYRMVLLFSMIPTVYYLLTKRCGKFIPADGIVTFICVWSTISIWVNHGFMTLNQTVGIFWVETFGAYLLGRTLVRSKETFFSFVKTLVIASTILMPFAIYETLTGRNLIIEVFSLFSQTYFVAGMEPRWGLHRVQGPFPHPIHFGVFFLSTVGLTFYSFGYGKRKSIQLATSLQTAIMGSFSLSSGPLVSLTIQTAAILWDGLFNKLKNHWWKLVAISIFLFVAIDLLSNRTPFHVVIEYLSFNKETAYNRIRIWEYGTRSIFAYPLFGIGFGSWDRPYWMSDSVDMFWILGGIRHGVPAWIAWISLYFSVFLPIAFRKNLNNLGNAYRKGYLVTLLGIFFSGWTVHYWDVTYAYLMFLFGAGTWFVKNEEIEKNHEKVEILQNKRGKTLYTRFHDGIHGERKNNLEKQSKK